MPQGRCFLTRRTGSASTSWPSTSSEAATTASRDTTSSGEASPYPYSIFYLREGSFEALVVTLEVTVRAAGSHHLPRAVRHAEPGADPAAGRGVRQRGGRGPLHRRAHGDEDTGRGEARTHLLMHPSRPGQNSLCLLGFL